MSERVETLKRRLKRRLYSDNILKRAFGIAPKESWLDTVWFSAYLYIVEAMDFQMFVEEIFRFGSLNNFETLEFLSFVEKEKKKYKRPKSSRRKNVRFKKR